MDTFWVLEVIKPDGKLTGVYMGQGRDFAYSVAKARKFRTELIAELVRNQKGPHLFRATFKSWDADLLEEDNCSTRYLKS